MLLIELLFSDIACPPDQTMANIPILPKPGPSSTSYRQKLSWEIKEQDWNRTVPEGRSLILQLNDKIPGTETATCHVPSEHVGLYPGGHIDIDDWGITFYTEWPSHVNIDHVNLQAEYSVRTNDGQFSVHVKSNGSEVDDGGLYLCNSVSIKPELLYDENRSFIVEAEIVVEMNLAKDDSKINLTDNDSAVGRSGEFVTAMKSLFSDEKNSDVVVIAEDRTFKCHKNILSARSEVFKNTLAHNTRESQSNTIVMQEIPAKAVEDMLKYLYSGDFPDILERLSIDLLHLAEMHQLLPLKEACVKNLMKGLSVSSCISMLLLVDRYMPHDADLREKVKVFIVCKAEEVVELEEWNQLAETHPVMATELTRAFVRGVGKHRCQWCILDYDTEG